MKGDRKIPTNTFVASADQLEPTFFKICDFSYFLIGSGKFPFLAPNSSRLVLNSYSYSLKIGRIPQPLFDQLHSIGKPYPGLVAQQLSRLLDAEEHRRALSRFRHRVRNELCTDRLRRRAAHAQARPQPFPLLRGQRTYPLPRLL